jgi:hypothetical protein
MFPKSMKPERIYGRHDIIFTEEENAIKKQLQRIYKIRDPKKLKKMIEDTSMEIVTFDPITESGVKYNLYIIRLLSCPDHIKAKLNFLLIHFNICHKQLISVQNYKGMAVAPNAITECLKWFHKLLFLSEDKYLPLFGYLKLNQDESIPIKFGPLQTFLVKEYLVPKQSSKKVMQVSLALLCYWYQTFNPKYFFENEKEYWKEMIESLGIMFNHSDSYGFSRFDCRGNFLDS